MDHLLRRATFFAGRKLSAGFNLNNLICNSSGKKPRADGRRTKGKNSLLRACDVYRLSFAAELARVVCSNTCAPWVLFYHALDDDRSAPGPTGFHRFIHEYDEHCVEPREMSPLETRAGKVSRHRMMHRQIRQFRPFRCYRWLSEISWNAVLSTLLSLNKIGNRRGCAAQIELESVDRRQYYQLGRVYQLRQSESATSTSKFTRYLQ